MEKIMTFAILICRKASFLGTPREDFIVVNYVQIHRFWRVFLNFGWMGVDWVWGVIERKCRVNQLAMSAASGFLLLLAATTSRIPKPPILLLLQDVTITFLLYTPTNIHNLLISIRQNRQKTIKEACLLYKRYQQQHLARKLAIAYSQFLCQFPCISNVVFFNKQEQSLHREFFSQPRGVKLTSTGCPKKLPFWNFLRTNPYVILELV